MNQKTTLRKWWSNNCNRIISNSSQKMKKMMIILGISQRKKILRLLLWTKEKLPFSLIQINLQQNTQIPMKAVVNFKDTKWYTAKKSRLMRIGVEDKKRMQINKIVRTTNSNNNNNQQQCKMEVKECVQNKKKENQNKGVQHKNNNS